MYNKLWFDILTNIVCCFVTCIFLVLPLGLVAFGVVKQMTAPTQLIVLCVICCTVAQVVDDRPEFLAVLAVAYGSVMVSIQQVVAEDH